MSSSATRNAPACASRGGDTHPARPGNRRDGQGRPGCRRQLPGEPDVREQVGAVRRHVNDEPRIAGAHGLQEGRARWRRRIQSQNSVVLIAEPELAR